MNKNRGYHVTVEDLEHIAEIGGVTLEELMSGDLVKTVRVVDDRKRKEKKPCAN